MLNIVKENNNGSKVFLVLSILYLSSGIIYAFKIFIEEYVCQYCDPKSIFGGVAIIANTILISLSGALARIGLNVQIKSDDTISK